MHRVDMNKQEYNEYFRDLWKNYFSRALFDVSYAQDWLDKQVIRIEAYLWCQQNIVESWNCRIINVASFQILLNEFYFEFISESDATAFKLRWL